MFDLKCSATATENGKYILSYKINGTSSASQHTGRVCVCAVSQHCSLWGQLHQKFSQPWHLLKLVLFFIHSTGLSCRTGLLCPVVQFLTHFWWRGPFAPNHKGLVYLTQITSSEVSYGLYIYTKSGAGWHSGQGVLKANNTTI